MKIFHKLGKVTLVVEDLGFSARQAPWGEEVLVEVLSAGSVVDTVVQRLQPDESLEDLLLHTARYYDLVAA